MQAVGDTLTRTSPCWGKRPGRNEQGSRREATREREARRHLFRPLGRVAAPASVVSGQNENELSYSIRTSFRVSADSMMALTILVCLRPSSPVGSPPLPCQVEGTGTPSWILAKM